MDLMRPSLFFRAQGACVKWSWSMDIILVWCEKVPWSSGSNWLLV